MELKRKLLNDSSGFTLIELVLVILVFAIMIVPVYKMLISGAKIQKTSEETYEATLQAQSILQSVKGQIEKDIISEQKVNRKLIPSDVADWLIDVPLSNTNQSLTNFLNGKKVTDPVTSDDVERFRKTFKSGAFLYEVHIWGLEDGEINATPFSMVEYDTVANPQLVAEPPTFGNLGEMPEDFTMVEIQDTMKDYFGHHDDSLLWTKPTNIGAPGDQDPKAVGVITYDTIEDEIVIAGGGMKPDTIGFIEGYEGEKVDEKLPKRTHIDYSLHTEGTETTYEFILSDSPVVPDVGHLTEDDFIYLTVDLATFPYTTLDPDDYVKDNDNRIIRIENKTAATVVVPMYNEKDLGVKIFPIQHQTKGNIVVERRDKREPGKNFVIGVIVRDAFNSTFGKPNKILSKIVDVYSYDYNKE